MLDAARRVRLAEAAVLASPAATVAETTTDSVPATPAASEASSDDPVAGQAGHTGTGDRRSAPDRPVRLAPSSRQAIQAAVATGLALLAGAGISQTRQYWAAIAAFVILSGTQTIDQTVIKGAQRLAGTLAGVLVGCAIAIAAGASPAVVLPLLALCLFAAVYEQPASYAQMAFWMTMLLALLYEFLGKLSAEALGLRVVETAVGTVIALVVAALILPGRARDDVTADTLTLLRTVDDIAQASLTRLAAGEHGADRASADRYQLLTLDQVQRGLYRSAEPLRTVGGALGRDGIERLLTALAALTYQARNMITEDSRFPGPGRSQEFGATRLPSQTIDQLAAVTRDNLEALARVIDGEPVSGMREITDVLPPSAGPKPEPARGDPAQRVIHSVMRINQTAVALAGNLSQPEARAGG
ncbi:MAG: FUSC family protein [Streptosporangiaceae bacterium]